MADAADRTVERRELVGEPGRRGVGEEEFELREQTRERCAQLVRGIRDEPLLRLVEIGEQVEESVDGHDQRPHLAGHSGLGEARQIARGTSLDAVGETAHGAQPEMKSEPQQEQYAVEHEEVDEQIAEQHRARCGRSPPHGFGHRDIERAAHGRGVQHGDAQLGALPLAVAEDRAVGR